MLGCCRDVLLAFGGLAPYRSLSPNRVRAFSLPNWERTDERIERVGTFESLGGCKSAIEMLERRVNVLGSAVRNRYSG